MAAGSVRLRNPDTGLEFGCSLPLPYGIRRLLDAGRLEDITRGAEKPAELAEHETLPRPRGNASREAWIKYALSQGMPEAEAVTLSRDALRARFDDPQFDPDRAPDLED